METKEKVLQVMREAGEPVNAGKIVELNLDEGKANVLIDLFGQ